MTAHLTNERLLSSVLEGLMDPAILVEPDRRILASNKAFRRRFSPDKDPRGCFCYEITHARSTPCRPEEVGGCPLVRGATPSFFHRHAMCLGEAYEEIFAHPVEGQRGSIAAHLLVTHPLRCSVQLVGRSRSFNRMMRAVRRASESDTPTLVWGETGSGKTCVARAIHDLSRRANRPFTVVNGCASSGRNFAEELFGVERSPGARGRRGLIELAKGGTLMVRSVDEIPEKVLPRLAEAIEKGVFTRIGGEAELRSDVGWVLTGERLCGFRWLESIDQCDRVSVPALRSRTEDLGLLVERMIMKFGEARVRGISDEALRLLERHSFPGNIRELEGVVERACLLADGELLLPEQFQDLNGALH